MTTTIAIACHAGGVGKTTTTRHLAQALPGSVTAIDLDPQHSLSTAWGIGSAADIRRMATTTDLLTGRGHLYQNNIDHLYQTESAISLIPATIQLQETAAWLQLQITTHDHLKLALDAAQPTDRPDWILLDCPPAADLLTINALVAADFVIVPVIPEPKGLDGLTRMIELVAWLRQRNLSQVRILGTVTTQIDRRTRLHSEHAALIATQPVPLLAEIPAARGMDAESRLAEHYQELAQALPGHIARRTRMRITVADLFGSEVIPSC